MRTDTNKIENSLEEDRSNLKNTVNELETRMSFGRLIDEALSAIDSGPGEFSATLGRQLRDKPLPALLTGVGLAWMMTTDRNQTQTPQPGYRNGYANGHANGHYTNGNASGDAARTDHMSSDNHLSDDDFDAMDRWDQTQEAKWTCVKQPDEDDATYERRLAETQSKHLGVTRGADEDDKSFSDRVNTAGTKVRDQATRARDKMRGAYRSTGNGASSAAGAIGGAAQSGYTNAQSAAKSAVDRSAAFHEDYPLATGAIGLAIGALVGSSMPLSREEHDRLKDVVDQGLVRGADAARSAAGSVQRGAERTNEAIRNN